MGVDFILQGQAPVMFNVLCVAQWLKCAVYTLQAIYADAFYQGDRKQAERRLRTQAVPAHKRPPIWRIYRLGFYSGITLMALAACILEGA